MKLPALPPMPKVPAQSSGRLEFAQWLTQPTHPLTSRVMVNRLWQHLFGEGLVRTPDDFGITGADPSHPELLDHLAIRFVENGYSLKKMIRAMMLSRTYRLSSGNSEFGMRSAESPGSSAAATASSIPNSEFRISPSFRIPKSAFHLHQRSQFPMSSPVSGCPSGPAEKTSKPPLSFEPGRR